MLPGARQAEARPLVQRQSIERLAVERDVPASAGNTPEIRLNSDVLPAPLGPIKPEDAALAHRQVDVVGDDDAAKTFAQ